MHDPKRILIAVDGSPHALDAVDYIARQEWARSGLLEEVHLFSVLPLGYEEVFWQVPMDEEFTRRMQERYDQVAAESKRSAARFLEECQRNLVEAGIPESRIRCSLKLWQEGIARDILCEARRGYDAVVVGRRGMGRMESILLGSVSNKIVQNLVEVPLWVVGGPPHSNKVLLAVDASENSRKAVASSAPFLSNGSGELILCHVVRSSPPVLPPTPLATSEELEGELLERLAREVARMFEGYRVCLESFGVGTERIRTTCKIGSTSRAADILATAGESGCGTIILGRRGISAVREFLMGRVTTKVLNGAEGLTVWIVP